MIIKCYPSFPSKHNLMLYKQHIILSAVSQQAYNTIHVIPTCIKFYPRYPNDNKILSNLSKHAYDVIHVIQMIQTCIKFYPRYPNIYIMLSTLSEYAVKCYPCYPNMHLMLSVISKHADNAIHFAQSRIWCYPRYPILCTLSKYT